jgi:hypothetical protein
MGKSKVTNIGRGKQYLTIKLMVKHTLPLDNLSYFPINQ